jgi:hypothetical protein
MELTEEIAGMVGIDVRRIGGLDLISFRDAGRFLDACSSAEVLVVGIEGFFLEGRQVRPDMSAIADFSRIEDARASVDEAKSFVKMLRSNDLLLDFTLTRPKASG